MAAEKGYPFSLFALLYREQITKYKTLEALSSRCGRMINMSLRGTACRGNPRERGRGYVIASVTQ